MQEEWILFKIKHLNVPSELKFAKQSPFWPLLMLNIHQASALRSTFSLWFIKKLKSFSSRFVAAIHL